MASVQAEQLIELFYDTFFEQFNIRLVGGAEEPLYLPAGSRAGGDVCGHHRLYFRLDYVSSAFHEIAHWCIAGPERRLQVDFGYWYQPDGRTAGQQRFFERAEIKPQALEWHFSVAAGHRFHLSADNLNGEAGVSGAFARAVCRQARKFCTQSLPPRARRLIDVLQSFYGTGDTLQPSHYSLRNLVV